MSASFHKKDYVFIPNSWAFFVRLYEISYKIQAVSKDLLIDKLEKPIHATNFQKKLGFRYLETLIL